MSGLTACRSPDLISILQTLHTGQHREAPLSQSQRHTASEAARGARNENETRCHGCCSREREFRRGKIDSFAIYFDSTPFPGYPVLVPHLWCGETQGLI